MAVHLAPIGICTLDEQHLEMGGMLRAFQIAVLRGRPAAEIRVMIETSMAALRAHCRQEEALMTKSAYPDAAAHRLDHERLVLAASAFSEDVLHHRQPPEILNEHGDLLRSIFVAHMDRDDRALAQHLMRVGLG
ncbi:bacteriohemerythrin [Rhizomicrobium electricum]|nr:hemerythrin family protein [Rhizomicrobium electricum]NIJ49489.1 hemerythrin-like metal-binding protein [Rhizomicrobium electricum]